MQGDLPVSESTGFPIKARSPDYRPLNLRDTYICPVCRHGHLTEMAMMDAFACNFCRHIFAVNLAEQSIRVEDSSQRSVWHWNGHRWQSAYATPGDITIVLWLVSVLVMTLPAGIVWLSFYTFPPLEGSRLSWLPLVWFVVTFLFHTTMVSWLVLEHYQVPFYVTLKVRISRLLRQR